MTELDQVINRGGNARSFVAENGGDVMAIGRPVHQDDRHALKRHRLEEWVVATRRCDNKAINPTSAQRVDVRDLALVVVVGIR